MDRLVPPMEPEPPPDYLAFVRGSLVLLRHEAARLVDDAGSADQVYPAVLCDVARHWRRLRWQHRHGRPDAARDYLRRRLSDRARQWRDERIYPVDVKVTAGTPTFAPQAFVPSVSSTSVLSPPVPSTFGPSAFARPVDHAEWAAQRPVTDSVALRMAALLPGTARAQAGPVAEANIAWEHAYHVHCWWRLSRRLALITLAVVAVMVEMSRISG